MLHKACNGKSQNLVGSVRVKTTILHKEMTSMTRMAHLSMCCCKPTGHWQDIDMLLLNYEENDRFSPSQRPVSIH